MPIRSGFSFSHLWFEWFFFFSSRRRHTRFDCDWSSDVCSSDLLPPQLFGTAEGDDPQQTPHLLAHAEALLVAEDDEIGRASCRERVEISGVAVVLKRKESVDDAELEAG